MCGLSAEQVSGSRFRRKLKRRFGLTWQNEELLCSPIIALAEMFLKSFFLLYTGDRVQSSGGNGFMFII